MTFHTLKYEFAKLFNEVSALLNGPLSLDVQSVLQLDRKLRSVELATPKELKVQLDPFAMNVNTSPQGHMLALLLHKALLGKLPSRIFAGPTAGIFVHEQFLPVKMCYVAIIQVLRTCVPIS